MGNEKEEQSGLSPEDLGNNEAVTDSVSERDGDLKKLEEINQAIAEAVKATGSTLSADFLDTVTTLGHRIQQLMTDGSSETQAMIQAANELREANFRAVAEPQGVRFPYDPTPAPPGPGAFNKMEVLKRQGSRIKEAQKTYASKALRTGKLESLALYYDGEKWLRVSSDKEYRKRQLELAIIIDNLPEIIALCEHQGAKETHVVELGPGDGKKTKEIYSRLIEKLKKMNLHLVDASPDMLVRTLVQLLNEIKNNAYFISTRSRSREDHPYKQFIDLLRKYKLKPSDDPKLPWDKVEIIMHSKISPDDDPRYTPTPLEQKLKKGDLLKFCLARLFALHRTENSDIITDLDDNVQLPLKITPHWQTFNNVDSSLFTADETHSSIIFHQGNEICNAHPSEPIAELYDKKLLNKPIVPEGVEDPKEEEIIANRAVVGFQLGKFDDPGRRNGELSKEAAKILAGYDIPNFNDFVSHMFFDPNIVQYSDSLDRNIAPENCIEVVADFMEDPDNPGYYGTVHKLRFTRKVNATITRGDTVETIEKSNGDEILLLASYKPTINQMHQLFAEKHIKPVRIFTNAKKDPTHAVFLVRKMTDAEIKEYEETNAGSTTNFHLRDSQKLIKASKLPTFETKRPKASNVPKKRAPKASPEKISRNVADKINAASDTKKAS